MDLVVDPIPRTPEDSPKFLRHLVHALREALRTVVSERRGISQVIGSLTIQTTLSRVDGVFVSLHDDPVAASCWVSGRATGTPGEIVLNVFDNAGVASLLATNVSWVAYGL